MVAVEYPLHREVKLNTNAKTGLRALVCAWIDQLSHSSIGSRVLLAVEAVNYYKNIRILFNCCYYGIMILRHIYNHVGYSYKGITWPFHFVHGG